MAPPTQTRQIADILAKHPQLAFDFYCAASEIVDDFEDYGPVLQANEASTYDDSSAIIKLRNLRDKIIRISREAPPK